jgi:hypothetical protein
MARLNGFRMIADGAGRRYEGRDRAGRRQPRWGAGEAAERPGICAERAAPQVTVSGGGRSESDFSRGGARAGAPSVASLTGTVVLFNTFAKIVLN